LVRFYRVLKHGIEHFGSVGRVGNKVENVHQASGVSLS
jgi:hypothetical protein